VSAAAAGARDRGFVGVRRFQSDGLDGADIARPRRTVGSPSREVVELVEGQRVEPKIPGHARREKCSGFLICDRTASSHGAVGCEIEGHWGEPQDWEWIPLAGSRSVRAIAQHLGECKRMYENHAFGDGKLSWNHFSPDLTATRTRALQFLRESQERLRTSIAALGGDSERCGPARQTGAR
jgi:hypothetical protein